MAIKAWIDEKWLRYQFNAKARIDVYANLGNYVEAGWGLTEAINQNYIIASRDGRRPDDPIAVIMDNWRRRMLDGMSFAEAIEPWVPEDERVIVSSSEKSDLPRAVRNLKKIYGAKSVVRGAIIGNLSYPTLLTAMCLGFIIFFRLFVVPSFADIMPRSRWGLAPSILAGTGDFIIDFGIIIAILVISVGAIVSWSLANWTGPLRKRFDRLPPWSVYKVYQGASFMLMLSAMRASGETDYGALSVMLKSAPPWLYEQLAGPRLLVADGVPIGVALYRKKIDFPDEKTVLDLRSYATLPDFAEVLERTGQKWLEDAVVRITRQLLVINYLVMFLVGFTIFGFLATIASLAIQLVSTTQF